MNDIEKINEELRNYKLFKIQRLNSKEKEFTELKNDFVKIKKNEILNLLIGVLNIISIIYLVYNLNKTNGDFKNNDELIINFVITTIVSIYLTYKFIDYNFKLKRYIKTSENAVIYFSNESDRLKSIYENYVDNYLEDLKRKK